MEGVSQFIPWYYAICMAMQNDSIQSLRKEEGGLSGIINAGGIQLQ